MHRQRFLFYWLQPRQSYAHQPMPRMRNTIMTSGDKDPKEILENTIIIIMNIFFIKN